MSPSPDYSGDQPAKDAGPRGAQRPGRDSEVSSLPAELTKLRRMLLTMSAEVEQRVTEALDGLLRHDLRLAEKVRYGDDEIDQMDVDVEAECVTQDGTVAVRAWATFARPPGVDRGRGVVVGDPLTTPSPRSTSEGEAE